MAEQPPPEVVATFAPAQRDSINHGVFDSAGRRRPPTYSHHVDDNLYGDIKELFPRTVSASLVAIYGILGFPQPNVPDTISREKLDPRYTHERKEIGRFCNSRSLDVGILVYKKDQLLETLADWALFTTFELPELASLHGQLEDATRYCHWARPWFAALTSALRLELERRFHILQRWYEKSGRAARIRGKLNEAVMYRLEALISRDKSNLIWGARRPMNMTLPIRCCLAALHRYLSNPANNWATPIAYIIPRDHHVESVGDASRLAGGGYCPRLRFWFDVIWSPRVRHGANNLTSSAPNFVHINSLEFIVINLQLAAVVTRLAALTDSQRRSMFPHGFPVNPLLLSETDNTTSKGWANKATAKTVHGVGLIGVYAELLRNYDIGVNCEHLAGF
jgi:hypothetical protein